MKIEKVALSGDRVRLEPLSAAHLPALAEAIQDGELWKIPVTFVPHPSDLPKFYADSEAAFDAGKELAFATVDQSAGQVVGSTRFRCIEAAHRRVEIGFTFLAASWQRTHINTEAKYLMLQHAFQVWGCNRVELLTDERNAKSRSAIARIGAREEGILRHHMVMRDGFIRNSVVYSITSADWPRVQAKLASRLQG
ncbi:MAG: GNAT family N-acetyltransferase [Burkholderiales bacterium]|nr:GNAT family N-acetyltransferase [Burkholderiales bacterium]MDE2076090.1 GNAT family N-acetyltransferase [Burkholderiales bacterium]MDE2431470.1 GNAT family N-acetyltransferase [Burkholderiales bacterium]